MRKQLIALGLTTLVGCEKDIPTARIELVNSKKEVTITVTDILHPISGDFYVDGILKAFTGFYYEKSIYDVTVSLEEVPYGPHTLELKACIPAIWTPVICTTTRQDVFAYEDRIVPLESVEADMTPPLLELGNSYLDKKENIGRIEAIDRESGIKELRIDIDGKRPLHVSREYPEYEQHTFTEDFSVINSLVTITAINHNGQETVQTCPPLDWYY